MPFVTVLAALVILGLGIFQLLRTINKRPKMEASQEEKITWLPKLGVSILIFLMGLFISPFMILSVLVP